MPRYEELSKRSALATFEELPGEAEPQWHESKKLLSFNAYFGARAIAEALDRGAQIVVTGDQSLAQICPWLGLGGGR